MLPKIIITTKLKTDKYGVLDSENMSAAMRMKKLKRCDKILFSRFFAKIDGEHHVILVHAEKYPSDCTSLYGINDFSIHAHKICRNELMALTQNEVLFHNLKKPSKRLTREEREKLYLKGKCII